MILLLAADLKAASSIGNISTTKNIKEVLSKVEEDSQREADLARQSLRFVRRDPFIPQKIDYGFELGTKWQDSNLYHLGANVGWHVGTCIFSDSQTCQQYIDLIGSLNGRESYTHYSGQASLRWQWVRFPSSWSILARILAGGQHSIIPSGSVQRPTYGIGLGVTTFLHPRADIRTELRFGRAGGDYYSELFISAQLKIDRWLEYFANKVKDLGAGAVGVTGTVIKGTVNVTGEAIKGTGKVLKGTAETVGEIGGEAVDALVPDSKSPNPPAPTPEPPPQPTP